MSKFGEKLAPVLALIKSPRASLKEIFGKSEEPFVVKLAAFMCVLSVFVMLSCVTLMVKRYRASHARTVASLPGHHAPIAHAEGHAPEAEGHGGGLGQSPYPESIISRQDGEQEPDHDLVDPIKSQMEIFKEGLKQKDLEVSKAYYFVSINKIATSAKDGKQSSGGIFAEITLEVSNAATEQEAMAHMNELRALITAIIAEKDRAELSDVRVGFPQLKKDIQERAQHLLKAGQIRDVLITKFSYQ